VFVLHGRIQISIFVRSCIQIFVDFRHSAWSISSVGDLISASLVLSTPVKAYVVRIQYTRAASSMNSQHHPTTANDLSRKRRKTSCNTKKMQIQTTTSRRLTTRTCMSQQRMHLYRSSNQDNQCRRRSLYYLEIVATSLTHQLCFRCDRCSHFFHRTALSHQRAFFHHHHIDKVL
jgi:hypothetical protein